MGVGVSKRLSVAYSVVLAGALALLAGPAAALGLGQIQVKSHPGQPLLAEIPIISGDPAELQGLQVRLAPPETFERVGLQPPSGDVSALRFEPALDAQGRPVIRVTSVAPLQQSLLTFLVEVNSNGIRLVREVSALLDAPRTVAAPAQPPIQAPVVAPSNTVVRPAEVPVATVPPPAAAPMPTPTPVRTPAPQATAPVIPAPAPAPVTAIPLPPPAPSPVATAAPPATRVAAPAAELEPVRAGQTLSQIARQLEPASGYTLDQTMLALLRSNPEAFIGDDINRLKQGAVLRVPQASELSHYSASQAAAVVREQLANWRQARRPTPQPATVATAATAPVPQASTSKPTSTKTPRVAAARLEIVPPSASSGRRAGTRSGIEAGGEGDMLRQQLQETKESLAARNAEVQELKTRVAELEKLQQQQQQLLTMKDSELAAAQQTLAKSNAQATQTAPSATTTQAQQPVPAPEPAARTTPVWLWAGLALVVAALLAWWLARRRRPAAAAPVIRGFDTAALAASIPSAQEDDHFVDGGLVDGELAGADEETADAEEEFAAEMQDETDLGDPVDSELASVATGWNPATAVAPTWHAGAGLAHHAAPMAADAANASQQLELARAYLDLGDDNAARELLREVLDGRDPAARAEAARLLRDL
jgi:pilus assembly protein FimV